MRHNGLVTQEPFGDIPLFRELQRLLSSSHGPINVEIASQVGSALIAQAGAEPTAGPGAARAFEADVHRCEALLAGYTRREVDEPARSRVLSRHEWMTTTLDAWGWLLARLSTRFSSGLSHLGDEAAGGNPMQAAMGQITPLLLGIQTGTLLGNLATEALARYDLPLPREDDGLLFLLPTNFDAARRDLGLDPDAFRGWLALHEASRHLLVTTVPWLERYQKSLLGELVDSIEIDTGDLERRLIDLQSQGMDALQGGTGAQDAFPIVPTERHKRAHDRLTAFLALFEGYAIHASRAVAGEIIGEAKGIDEVLTRRRTGGSDGERLVTQMLGLNLDHALEEAGATFAAAVVKLKGPDTLNLVWDAPDNLPSLEEIRDPFVWMERDL